MSETMKNLVEGEDAFRDDGGVGKIGPLRSEALLEHREYTREVQDQEALRFFPIWYSWRIIGGNHDQIFVANEMFEDNNGSMDGALHVHADNEECESRCLYCKLSCNKQQHSDWHRCAKGHTWG